MSAKVNWGKIVLVSFLSAAGFGAYEFANLLIDKSNINSAGQSVDNEGVERSLIGPNMYRVVENGFTNTFNFSSKQLISNTNKSETITLFNAMDNATYIQRNLSDACALAHNALTQLDGSSTWSLLPWRESRFVAAQETARTFIASHCPQPEAKP